MTQLVWRQRLGVFGLSRAKMLAAAVLAIAVVTAWAVAAYADTDFWCGPGSGVTCNVRPAGGFRNSGYQHHFTLVYVHDVTLGNPGTAYLGAGVNSCFGIAHAFGVVTHSYSTTCLSTGRGENDNDIDNGDSTLDMHGDF